MDGSAPTTNHQFTSCFCLDTALAQRPSFKFSVDIFFWGGGDARSTMCKLKTGLLQDMVLWKVFIVDVKERTMQASEESSAERKE